MYHQQCIKREGEGNWSWLALNYLIMLLFRKWISHEYTVCNHKCLYIPATSHVSLGLYAWCSSTCLSNDLIWNREYELQSLAIASQKNPYGWERILLKVGWWVHYYCPYILAFGSTCMSTHAEQWNNVCTVCVNCEIQYWAPTSITICCWLLTFVCVWDSMLALCQL